jgi:hypothetical protein
MWREQDVVALLYDAHDAHSFAGAREMRISMTKLGHVAPCIIAAVNMQGAKHPSCFECLQVCACIFVKCMHFV